VIKISSHNKIDDHPIQCYFVGGGSECRKSTLAAIEAALIQVRNEPGPEIEFCPLQTRDKALFADFHSGTCSAAQIVEQSPEAPTWNRST
jgi:hypothetical protein